MALPTNPPATTTPAALKTWAQAVVDTATDHETRLDVVEAWDAGDIAFTPAGTVAATTVQAAIEEVASEAVAAIGPATDIDGATVTAGQILASDTEVMVALGDDPATLANYDQPLISLTSDGFYAQSDATGTCTVSVSTVGGSGPEANIQAGSPSRVHLGPNGISFITNGVAKIALFGSTFDGGIDGTDTVADATDAASVIARLNELLAVLRNLGVLTT